MSPLQRARMVAERLRALDAAGRLRPETADVGRVGNTAALVVDGVPVATVDPRWAREMGVTPGRLATSWQNHLVAALRGDVASQPSRPARVGQKLVPIVSVGTGIRVGVALVSGERARLDNTRAVAMLETVFQRVVRARLLVPISTTSGLRDLDRVPGVAVIAVGDIEI